MDRNRRAEPAQNPDPAGGPPTASQLRDDIDQGLMDDKVAARDPAVVPLGTDDEAAGTPPGAEAVARAMARKRRDRVESTRGGLGRGVWILVLAVGVALVVWLASVSN